jgi:ribosomal protein L12E/L44/L45/RPP1/RPP2
VGAEVEKDKLQMLFKEMEWRRVTELLAAGRNKRSPFSCPLLIA